MRHSLRLRTQTAIGALMVAGVCTLAVPASAQDAAYHPINPTMTGTTITLTGNNLTVDQVVQVARYGAKVKLSPEAKQRNVDTFNLMNEAAAEGIPVYLFNRNAGSGRETVRFSGDPMSPENHEKLVSQVMQGFMNTPNAHGPEFSDEDNVRAMMVVRANQMTYQAISPSMMQGLIDLINNDITPVMRSRAGTGEAQGPSASPMNTAMVGGHIDVYYKGVRMPAAQALQQAGLKPVSPEPGDSTMGSINADVAGLSVIAVADAKRYLDWVDLVYAIDLDGMNSSLTPMFMPNQVARPFKWINWDSARILDMLKGGYLFEYDAVKDADPKNHRIIQDPESMRAGYVRQGSAWEEWANLRDAVQTQINGTEHNPITMVNVSPKDSWELSSPWAMRYYVKGSAANGNKHGFVFSNANWDPYPLSNRLEAFTIALANMDVAVMLRQEKFSYTFFTEVTAQEVLNPGDGQGGPGGGGAQGGNGGWANHEVWQTIQSLIVPVPPEGYSSDPQQVEELDAESLFKAKRAIAAIDESWMLLANDLNTGARWMDVRKKQDPSRTFGAAPTAAVAAFHKAGNGGLAALNFLKSTPATNFYPAGPAMPGETGGKTATKQTKQ